MFGMEQHDLVSWTMAHPAAATALATMALVAVGLVIGLGQIGAIVYGIWKMGQGNKARAEQHREAMDTEANRHKEAMEKLAAERTESERRHQENMKALGALIRNTAPGAATAG
ncbi:MAG: hypothetical protein OXH05_10590 [Acidobacteria bacterium]|nr:hypothetical protein [Acidobacteriota bacterium]